MGRRPCRGSIDDRRRLAAGTGSPGSPLAPGTLGEEEGVRHRRRRPHQGSAMAEEELGRLLSIQGEGGGRGKEVAAV